MAEDEEPELSTQLNAIISNAQLDLGYLQPHPGLIAVRELDAVKVLHILHEPSGDQPNQRECEGWVLIERSAKGRCIDPIQFDIRCAEGGGNSNTARREQRHLTGELAPA
jgi:hypothetical protein